MAGKPPKRPTGRFLIPIISLALLAALAVFMYRQRQQQQHQREAEAALAAGLAAFDAKDYAQAATELSSYLASGEQNTSIMLKFAQAELHCRPRDSFRVDTAASALERILLRDWGHPQASETLAELYLSTGKFTEGERVSRAWMKSAADPTKPGLLLTSALLAQAKRTEAIELLERLLEGHPERAEPAARLAFIRLAEGLPRSSELAGRILDAAVNANPGSPVARLARARYYLETGQLPKLPDEVNAAVNTAADSASLLQLAEFLVRLGDYARARSAVAKAEKHSPEDPDVYVSAGRLLLTMADTQLGAELATRALSAPLGTLRYDVLPVAAELLAAAGRTVEARECITQLRESDGPREVLLHLEGLAELSEDRPYAAITTLQEAIRLAPLTPDPHLTLGRAYARISEPRRAAGSLQQYLRLASGTPVTVWLELAQLWAEADRWPEAAAAAATAVSIAPANPQAVRISLEIQAEIAQPNGPRPNAAILMAIRDRAAELVSAHPDDLQLQLLLARLHVWAGERQQAINLLEMLRAKPASRAAASLQLAHLFALTSDWDQALAACSDAVAAAGSGELAASLQMLAQLKLARGDTAVVEQVITAARRLPLRERSALHVRLAEALRQANQPQAARTVLTATIAEDAQNVPARLLLLALDPPGTNPDSQELVAAIRAIQGENGLDWKVWQARLWLEGNNWTDYRTQIETVLHQVLARDPARNDAVITLALHHERSQEVRKALEMYRRAFEADPSDLATGHRYLRLAVRAQRWLEVDRALELLPPDDPVALEEGIARALRRGDAHTAERLKAELADRQSGKGKS